LREKHGGILEGQKQKAFKDLAKENNKDIRDFFVKEGESWKDVNSRAKDFLVNEVINKHLLIKEEEKSGHESPPVQNMLVVTHGGFIMEFLHVVKKFQDQRYVEVFKNNAKNGCLFVFNLVSKNNKFPTFSIEIDNDAAHMDMTFAQLR